MNPLEPAVVMALAGTFHGKHAAVFDEYGKRYATRAQCHGVKVATDPHWKRVAKDRARKKAAKRHKKHMRRSGK